MSSQLFFLLSLLLDVLCKQWVNVSQRLLSEWGGGSGFHSMGLICIIMYGDAHFFPMQRIQTFFKHKSFSMDFFFENLQETMKSCCYTVGTRKLSHTSMCWFLPAILPTSKE